MLTVKRGVAPLAGAWIETVLAAGVVRAAGVAPLAGAWIETTAHRGRTTANIVAPLAGAWIETNDADLQEAARQSRPSRARGLKPCWRRAWFGRRAVAPLAGAWIETSHMRTARALRTSRPSRARGLKRQPARNPSAPVSRAPRGRVD